MMSKNVVEPKRQQIYIYCGALHAGLVRLHALKDTLAPHATISTPTHKRAHAHTHTQAHKL
jgi:hypothetical protein